MPVPFLQNTTHFSLQVKLPLFQQLSLIFTQIMIKSSQVPFIYIALLTIQIVTAQYQNRQIVSIM